MSEPVLNPSAERESQENASSADAWNPFDSSYLPDQEALGKSHFQFSFLFIPSKARRQALGDLYAYCRLLDDISDAPHLSKDRRAELTTNVRAWLTSNQLIGHPYWDRWKILIGELKIPVSALEAIIDGVEKDLNTHLEFQRWEDLVAYADQVASAVGIATLAVMGAYESDPSRAENYAKGLGRALQFLNIMRDLEEDSSLGRNYIPLEFSLPPGATKTRDIREELLKRAEQFRAKAKPYSWRCLPAEIMANCYFYAGRKWWQWGSPRRLTTWEKVQIALKTLASLPFR